jgi:hypothetical protein
MSKLCIGPLLVSSTHIQVLYDNLDEEEYSFDTYINDNISGIYESYKNSIKMPLDFDTVIQFINKFEKMNLYDTFVKATYEEYFNKTLNYLLVIDFIISFNKCGNDKCGNDKPDSRNVDHSAIFKFFIELSYFFKFMNYLDVTSTFLDYIKTMLVLYLQSLDRLTINIFFSHVIWILDDFFKFEVVKHLLCDKLQPKYYQTKTLLVEFETNYLKELQSDYDKNIDYTTSEYDHLDKKFYLTVMNCVCQRIINTDDDEDYGVEPILYVIYQADINYELYRKQFIFKIKQEKTKIIVNTETQINELLKDIKIKDLSSLKTNLDNLKYFELLTYIGESVDYSKLNNYINEQLFNIAYNMVYFDIIKDIVETTNLKPQIKLYNDFGYQEINNYLKSKNPYLKETVFITCEIKT